MFWRTDKCILYHVALKWGLIAHALFIDLCAHHALGATFTVKKENKDQPAVTTPPQKSQPQQPEQPQPIHNQPTQAQPQTDQPTGHPHPTQIKQQVPVHTQTHEVKVEVTPSEAPNTVKWTTHTKKPVATASSNYVVPPPKGATKATSNDATQPTKEENAVDDTAEGHQQVEDEYDDEWDEEYEEGTKMIVTAKLSIFTEEEVEKPKHDLYLQGIKYRKYRFWAESDWDVRDREVCSYGVC